ncbi:DoxX family protein [Candidatus Kaiserbacteria bacterium]|nr:DoxX family protein [Candidatus Kaiserbacteria bacterium]
MKSYQARLIKVFSIITTFLLASEAKAHEVYVLTADQVKQLETEPAVSFLDIFSNHVSNTIIWGLIVSFIIVSVFIISISVRLENKFDKYLVRLKHYAPFIARITVGLAFIFCAYESAMFGPELPFQAMYGQFSLLVQIAFFLLGLAMIFGFYSRLAGIIGLLFFGVGIINYGVYMVTYLNYLVELVVLVLVGGHKFSVKHEHHIWSRGSRLLDYISNKYGEFAFLILRVGFGVSLIYASAYAKIFHNQLALAVVEEYNLVEVFGFAPEFIVFGAAIIEILLGIFFILGLEIRFTSIVLNVFLTLSLLYFGEAVWPHIILIGVPIAFFCYGYDKYSLEGYFFKKGNREPIF